ncbi:D-cysteine desulfhydrase 2, mitochondrial isoform X1 [Ipomoea triloba]|uniref:D-cysteine desulfhydrase 2, mitochondrial isoform X1 n=1 Tax=Ipomoea triloba TaxID=35885 RepID=UPI00125E79FD|nr:D-cysteine desulfhydrase 2, mitochondrial isoform X1 [Ipomoea triloba]
MSVPHSRTSLVASLRRTRNTATPTVAGSPPYRSARKQEHRFSSQRLSSTLRSQGALELSVHKEEFVSKLLNRKWALRSPATQIHQIMVSNLYREQGDAFDNVSFVNIQQPSLGKSLVAENHCQPSFYVVRDDLLHPLVNGNKARKLDALLPLLEHNSVTDVVACGGCQSAHAAAVAVSCAERGLKSHLLLRGEQPETLTGYNLISTMYGNVRYVPRSLYAKREEMLAMHANKVAGSDGSIVSLGELLEASFSNQGFGEQSVQVATRTYAESEKKVVIINEGAGDAVGLLGAIRLVEYLSQEHLFGRNQALKVIVDAGTGTTAIGLGLGAVCLGLPWKVTAVMLADTIEGYRQKEKSLISEFRVSFNLPDLDQLLSKGRGVVHWVERSLPRKFGKALKGEVEKCQRIARDTGVLVDPVYTLAAWELGMQFSREEGAKAVMLHTGGTLGMFGLAQRYRSYFQMLNE